MAIARLRTAVEDYTLEEDRELPPEEQSVFKLKILSPHESARLQDRMTGEKTYAMNTLDAVREGLKGWENLNDADGNPIKFKGSKAGQFEESNLDYLEQEWILELGTEVLRMTFPTAFMGDVEGN
jgi:hypothetical protein